VVCQSVTSNPLNIRQKSSFLIIYSYSLTRVSELAVHRRQERHTILRAVERRAHLFRLFFFLSRRKRFTPMTCTREEFGSGRHPTRSSYTPPLTGMYACGGSDTRGWTIACPYAPAGGNHMRLRLGEALGFPVRFAQKDLIIHCEGVCVFPVEGLRGRRHEI
jgi:hypothetical protein